MHENACSSILQERSDSHRLEGRNEVVQIVAGSKQTQQGRAEESEQHGGSRIHPRSIGKDVDGESEKESPQHQFIPRGAGVELQYKVNIEKGSGVSGYMHVVEDKCLKKHQPHKPSDSMYIGDNQWIESSYTGDYVRISNVPWSYVSRARRVLN